MRPRTREHVICPLFGNMFRSKRVHIQRKCLASKHYLHTIVVSCGGLAPHYIFLCAYINNISISLDNSRFTHQYRDSSFNIMAELLQFISLPRLASIDVIDNVHLRIVALLLVCV